MGNRLAAVLAFGCFACAPPPEPPGGLTAQTVGSGGDCAAATGAETIHRDSISADETWAAGVHHVTASIGVRATLTIEACAKVILDKGVTITVADSSTPGALITRGTYVESPEALRPVIFTNAVDATHWGAIWVNPKGTFDASVTVLVNGGDIDAVSFDHGASLVARGPNDGSLIQNIDAKALFILSSGGVGAALESGAGFKTSPNSMLAIIGAGTQVTSPGQTSTFDPIYPLYIEPPGVGTLPEGIYRATTGETQSSADKILVYNNRTVTVDETFKNRGVPYRLEIGLDMRGPTFTIDPGVVLQQRAYASGNVYSIYVGDSGSNKLTKIDWQGTADQPIVFTLEAMTPTAGAWAGIVLAGSPAAGNKMSYARVEFAGGESGANGFGCGPGDNDAALIIRGWKPADAFISNCNITDSAGGGIVSGWESNDSGPNLKTGNTFTRIANGCDVSHWRLDAVNYCPFRPQNECL